MASHEPDTPIRETVTIVCADAERAAGMGTALSAPSLEVRILGTRGRWEANLRENPTPWVLFDAQSMGEMLTELASLRDQLTHARLELDERKLVERAKGLLMIRRGLSEPEAYRTLQKLAMDRKRKLADIAASVLEAGELFADNKT